MSCNHRDETTTLFLQLRLLTAKLTQENAFSLSLSSAGFCSIRWCSLSWACPSTGSTPRSSHPSCTASVAREPSEPSPRASLQNLLLLDRVRHRQEASTTSGSLSTTSERGGPSRAGTSLQRVPEESLLRSQATARPAETRARRLLGGPTGPTRARGRRCVRAGSLDRSWRWDERWRPLRTVESGRRKR